MSKKASARKNTKEPGNLKPKAPREIGVRGGFLRPSQLQSSVQKSGNDTSNAIVKQMG